MAYFQYITELYNTDGLSPDRYMVALIHDWLDLKVGNKGNYRYNELTDWSWSLTNDSSFAPVGIYFAREEDKLAFRLAFGIGFGMVNKLD